jgi:hypothetical protein
MPKKTCTKCGQLIFVACKTCPACKARCVSSKPGKLSKAIAKYKTHDRVQLCEYEDELEDELVVGRVNAAEAVPAEVVSVIFLDGTSAVPREVPPTGEDGYATIAFRDTLANNWLHLLSQCVTAEDRREIQRVLAERGKAGIDAVYAAYQVVVASGCYDQSMKLLHTHVGNYVAAFGMEALCRALPPLVAADLPPDGAAAAHQIEEIIFEGARYVPLTSSRAR